MKTFLAFSIVLGICAVIASAIASAIYEDKHKDTYSNKPIYWLLFIVGFPARMLPNILLFVLAAVASAPVLIIGAICKLVDFALPASIKAKYGTSADMFGAFFGYVVILPLVVITAIAYFCWPLLLALFS